MFDYAKLFRDLSSLDTDFSKFAFVTSLIIGLIVGLIMACVVMMDTFEFCNNILFRILLSCFGFIATTALTSLFFTFAIGSMLDASKPDYDSNTLKSLASENGVESLDNLKYNVDYLLNKYYSKGLVFTKESEDRYHYKSNSQLKAFKAVNELCSDEYINSILNKFYLNTEVDSYINSLIDNTELSYESVYKELKK